MASIRFLSVEDVLIIQQNTIEHEGGAAGLRDAGLLESAVMMPQQQFGGEYLHPDLASMAAAYLFHIAQNHPFQDGNKRAAVLAALVFLSVNEVEALPEPDDLEEMTMRLASSEVGKDELTEWMRGKIGSESGE